MTVRKPSFFIAKFNVLRLKLCDERRKKFFNLLLDIDGRTCYYLFVERKRNMNANLSILGWLCFVLFCICFIIGIVYAIVFLIREFSKCNADDVKKIYRDYEYIIFYTNGHKLIRTYHLSDYENKTLNDTLNRSPVVKSYKVVEK